MRAADFDILFERHTARPAVEAGFVPLGKGLWFEHGGLHVALLRTELRATWPFAFTLVARHDCLRDFDDRLPAPRSRNASEYPIKIRPSDLPALLDRFTYEPYNLGHWPKEDMIDELVERQVMQIGAALADSVLRLSEVLTPAVVLRQLIDRGEDAWCERRWIEDYRAAFST